MNRNQSSNVSTIDKKRLIKLYNQKWLIAYNLHEKAQRQSNNDKPNTPANNNHFKLAQSEAGTK